MDLRDLVSRNKGQEFLWTLIVEPGWVQAGIWTITDDTANVVAVSNTAAWETNEELVRSADSVLSSAVSSLPSDASEPKKVVFGVPASWVVEGQIKKDRLEGLKVLCSKLELTPAGFVTLPEAVSFYIKSTEGSPLSAVTISPGKETVEVTVFRLGNLLGTTQVARSVSIFDDVVEGLTRFKLQDSVPSRFILFNGKEGELEDAKQALLAGSWEGAASLKLMHTPKIEILSQKMKVEAVSLGGASEIAQVSKIQNVEKDNQDDQSETESDADDLGFVVEKDIANVDEPVKEQSESLDAEANPESMPPESTGKKRLTLTPIVARLKGFLGRFKNVSSVGSRPLIMGAGALVAVTVILVAFWWFYPKATVTIYLAPQKLDEKIELLADTQSSTVDFEKKVLPGRTIKEVVDGEKTTSTTGQKTVGEKAKGEVEIRNGQSDDITLTSDTSLVASNGLEFVVESEVVIDAQSSPGSPGSKTITVVAQDIGSEYNLSKDELFKVGNFPKAEIDARATTDFSGGSSRQIQAVSEDDRVRLAEELTAELIQKGKEALKNTVGLNEFYIEGSTQSTSSNQNYSGKAGDEADSLKLTETAEVSGVVVSKEDLFKLADHVLKGKVPQGYILKETQVEYEFELKEYKEDEKVYVLEGNVGANLLPEVNMDEVKKGIVGKYKDVALEYLSKIPGFVRAQINLNPRFPGRLGTLPHVINRITIDLAAEK